MRTDLLGRLGEVSSNRDVRPLWSLADRVQHKNVGMAETNLLSLSYGRIIRREIDEVGGLRPESYATYNIIEAGDTVLRMTDLQNDQRSIRTGLAKERGIITSAYVTVRPRPGVEPRFLAAALRAFDVKKVYYEMGAGVRQTLKFEELGHLPIPLPALHEQRRIADYLDRETAEIDTMDAELDRLMETLRERQAQTVEQVFSRLEAGEGPVGAVVLNQWSGKSVNGYSNAAVEGEVGILKTSAVSSGSFRSFQNKQVVEADLGLVRAPVNAGDVLVGRANSPELVGSAVLVENDHPNLYLSDKLWGLDLACEHGYFVHWTKTQRYRSQVRESLVGSSASMQNLSLTHFLRFRMPIPSSAEQRRIVAELDEQTARIDDMIADAQRLKALLAERRSTLITEVVTGRKEVPA